MLFPALSDPDDRLALRFGDVDLTYAQLRDTSAHVAGEVAGAERVGVWAVSAPETAVAVVGALLAGVAAVPINPKAGERELGHILEDSAPGTILCAPGAELPEALTQRPRIEVDLAARGGDLPDEPDEEAPALVVYTSGTTGPPKGAVLPRRSIASNLDALADAWEWTAGDVVAHGLPLFHVHGLVVGTLGSIRRGGATAPPRALLVGRRRRGARGRRDDGLRGADDVPPPRCRRRARRRGRGGSAQGATARVRVGGPARRRARAHRAAQRPAHRRALRDERDAHEHLDPGRRRPPRGYVGPPLQGVEIRLLDDAGEPIDAADDETIGEITVRGPNLFLEYLNRPDATAEAVQDGWFRTGDLATRAPDGYIRIVGRRATDLIKSGGYKIGAGEIEGALLEHPGVREAAVTGEPDPDLGERIVAWIVPSDGAAPSADELADHVAVAADPAQAPAGGAPSRRAAAQRDGQGPEGSVAGALAVCCWALAVVLALTASPRGKKGRRQSGRSPSSSGRCGGFATLAADSAG